MRTYSPHLLCFGGLLALSGGLAGCVEPYVPEVLAAPSSYLVVDGFINGNGRTTVLLTRTASLAATAAPAVEKGAKVFIVDDAGARYALAEPTGGTYRSDSLVLSPARRYQLRLTTAANAAYESDLVALKATPPIDKLGWQQANGQVQLALSTHDASGQSRYYRWGFAETWEFTASVESVLEYIDGKIQTRVTPIYRCWRTERASSVKQGTSAQLSQDALTDFPIRDVPTRDERFKIRYSVLVSQYAETAEEFAYNELLRKNTEAVGSVNDPLPTQLTGNVHRTGNAAEPVLGYVGAHTTQRARLFIDRKELALPNDWVFDSPYTGCLVDSMAEVLYPFEPTGPVYPRSIVFQGPNTVPINYYFTRRAERKAYIGSSAACADCRQRGSNAKPSFW